MLDYMKVINVALAEEGYVEKASNADLDNKTGNAGSANYTKYWRDVWPKLNGQGWCDCFVKWCFQTAYGAETAKEMLYCDTGNFTFNVSGSADFFKKVGQWFNKPKAGDQIFYKNGSSLTHTGLVYKVDNLYVYTIEGNTGTGSGVVPNGGGVARKRYALNYALIAGYGRPNYNGTISKVDPNEYSGISKAIKEPTSMEAGIKTESTTVLKVKTGQFNKEFAVALGLNKNAAAKYIYEASITVSTRTNNRHRVVTVLERYFKDIGFYNGEIEEDNGERPIYGPEMVEAVKRFQKDVIKAEPKWQDGFLSKKGDTWHKILGLED